MTKIDHPTTNKPVVAPTAPQTTTARDLGLLALRVVFGLLLAGHGTQKLFGWFDGFGLDKTGALFALSGYEPGKLFAVVAGLSEMTGGLLIAAGLLTPLAAAIMLGTMINAISETWKGGLLTATGWEPALLYATVATTMAFTGPGRFSLDAGRPWQREGLPWAAGSVVLATCAALVPLLIKWI
ncbi:DoxX family membrane protein [Actinomadura meridiana]|uniref:DoxX family membrane protein n=1 Tax=Actinomadura meridiana TaxID=559626 RepID=A0ABP8BVP4_9ACTN